MVYKPHETIDEVTSAYVGSAPDFLITLKNDGTTLWLNKTVTLKGKVTSKDDFGIVLNNAIYCQLKKQSDNQTINIEEAVSLKGQIIGYDDLLEELKLTNCIIKNTHND
ncbi:hypothetical protein P8625_09375 [Tenacibaculum tangerinum]|uniref:Uncharacterized protein n=1 Tax=Tenacibaculum tangerinum TaxID=3038772 RepID=A0ABY8KZQ5_9FLAO|nr:hypothetical protein [Tenacibaculum tangerinum]WGH74326.1 hypothetical protein P8625_09375 [Tenacibaculum tangerinum]